MFQTGNRKKRNNTVYSKSGAAELGEGGGGTGGLFEKNEKMCPFFDWMCVLFVLSSVPLIFNSVSIVHNCV